MVAHLRVGTDTLGLNYEVDNVSRRARRDTLFSPPSVEELREIAGAAGWQGYFSDPARASAAHGQAVENGWIEAFTDVIVRAIRGENMFGHPRFSDTVPPAVVPVTEKALASEAAFDAALQKWLAQRRQR